MNLFLGEPGSGGSSTPSMVGAVKKWQMTDPEKAQENWQKLLDANLEMETKLSILSKLAKDHWDVYIGVIKSCSVLTSEKIELESQTQLLDSTMNAEGVLLAGVLGTGGFDAIFAITLGDSGSKLTEAWSSHDVLALLVREEPHGVCLESGDPRTTGVPTMFWPSGVSLVRLE